MSVARLQDILHGIEKAGILILKEFAASMGDAQDCSSGVDGPMGRWGAARETTGRLGGARTYPTEQGVVVPVNDDVVRLLFDVVARLERSVEANECPAIVALEGERKLVLSDHDYLRDHATAETFERRVADRARQVNPTRWVFAVPQVWVINERNVEVRAVSRHVLRPGEQEAITWMAYDEGTGVDYGRVPYVRRPSGEPIFSEPEMFNMGLHSGPSMPGYVLLRALSGSDDLPFM